MRTRAANQNFLAQNTNINAAEKQRRLNQAARFREIGAEMNAAANGAAASSAASSQDYERKLRAKVTAHNARTSMAKVSEAELKQWEAELVKSIRPPTAEVKRIGEAVRRNIKAKTGMVAGRSSRKNKRSTRKHKRSTRRN